MITNPGYIKMILALPEEFFAGWEWNYGDTFILKVASDNWIVHHIGDFELTNNDIGTWAPIGGCESTFEKVEEERRPIPSQEQLQKMVINEFNGVPEIQLLESFYSWVKTQRSVDKTFEFHSIKCSMLRYAVLMLLRKKWDGEKWA